MSTGQNGDCWFGGGRKRKLCRAAQYRADRCQESTYHWRLAQELRKLDRLEESLESYQRAVEFQPELLGWRLALARARFDVLDYQGADADLQHVLQHVAPGSPLELPAKNQLAQLYESMERGRRFTPVLTPTATATQLKEWAAIRSEAWKLFEAGRFQDAEPIYRRLLVLNPSDPIATHQLGLTLMQLGRCEDALAVFGNLSNLNPSEEDFADTTYRMGQCYVELDGGKKPSFTFRSSMTQPLNLKRPTSMSRCRPAPAYWRKTRSLAGSRRSGPMFLSWRS